MHAKTYTRGDIDTERAAQIALLLTHVDVDDLVNEGIVTFMPDPADPIHGHALITVVIPVAHSDYIATSVPTSLLGRARQVAAAPPGVRAEYRRQWAEAPVGGGASIPIHPDQVDLWAAEIRKVTTP